MPTFSIIIPTYNRKILLKERALNSLLNQKFNDFEVIVINDGGEDVLDVIEEYKNKGLDIKYINYKENKSVSYARNRGIEIAKGEWICFLDDDDEYLKETLEIFNNSIFNRGNTIKCVIGQAIKKIDHQETILPPYKDFKKLNKEKVLKWILKGWITPGNLMVKKEFLINLQGFDEKIRVGEDLELGLRILFSINFDEEFIFIPKPVYIHYLRSVFNQKLNNFKKGLDDSIYILEKHKEKLKENNILDCFYYRLGVFHQAIGNKKEAIKYFILSFSSLPLRSFIRILLSITPISLFYRFEDLLLKLKIKFLK